MPHFVLALTLDVKGLVIIRIIVMSRYDDVNLALLIDKDQIRLL